MKTTIVLSGVKISISARFVDFDYPQWDSNNLHPHFKVRVRANNRSHTFDFWGSVMDYRNNKQELDRNDLLECLYCLITDASSTDCNADFVEFCKECGYKRLDEVNYAMQVYKMLKRAKDACERLFGKDYYHLDYELSEYLFR